jgi:hypothetical protein
MVGTQSRELSIQDVILEKSAFICFTLDDHVTRGWGLGPGETSFSGAMRRAWILSCKNCSTWLFLRWYMIIQEYRDCVVTIKSQNT